MKNVAKEAAAVLTAIIVLAIANGALAYEYPISDPYLATVVGTPEALLADVPDRIPLRVRKLDTYAGRTIPKALWYGKRLEYSFARQRGRAPLIFTIAGTGGYHNTPKNVFLQKLFYQAGYHVVGITSPSHPKFTIAASSTRVPAR